MQPPDMPGFVIPNPKGPKSIGLWSVLFSLLLLGCGVVNLGTMLAMPLIQRMLQNVETTAREQAQARQKATIDKLEADIKTIEDPEQKKPLEAQLESLKQQQVQKGPMIGVPFKLMTQPTLRAFFLTDYATAVVVNGMMLASGLGLLALKEWGRKLALWTAGIKIFRLAALILVNILIVLPISMVEVKNMMEQISGQGNGNPNSKQFVGMFQSLMDAMQTLVWVFAPIAFLLAIAFPIIVIVVLTRPASKAACLSPEKSELDLS
jgi:hypothetical protein